MPLAVRGGSLHESQPDARTFEPLAALPQEPFPASAANAFPVAIHGIAGLGVVRPLPTAAIRFGDGTPHAVRGFESRHPEQNLNRRRGRASKSEEAVARRQRSPQILYGEIRRARFDARWQGL